MVSTSVIYQESKFCIWTIASSNMDAIGGQFWECGGGQA